MNGVDGMSWVRRNDEALVFGLEIVCASFFLPLFILSLSIKIAQDA